MRHLFHTIIVALTLTSCASQYNIDGNSSLACLDGQKLYLRFTNYDNHQIQVVNLDSCEVIHGRFTFGGSIDSIALAEVYMGNEMLMPIVLEGGQLLMQVDNYGQTVTGGPLNERLTDFLKRRLRYDNDLWELDRKARKMLYEGASMKDVVARLEPRRRALTQQLEEMEIAFVLDNINNALGLGYFMQMANQLGFPTMTDQLQRIADQAPEAFLRHPQVSNYLFMAGYTRTARNLTDHK